MPPVLSGGLTAADWADIARARQLLSQTSAAVRLANAVGAPLEKGFQMLPAGWKQAVQAATEVALKSALRVAVTSLQSQPGRRPARNRWHRLLTSSTGAVGGAFGFVALPIELPLSTTIMLRSIAEIATSQGHDLQDPATRLECLQVFALGGASNTEPSSEQNYWLIRAGLAQALRNTAAALASGAVSLETAPAAVQLLARIAARFGVVVSEQTAAKAVPLLGAAAGAAINYAFLEHFQQVAEAHFILRRLENHHGFETIQTAFRSTIAQTQRSSESHPV